MDKNNVRISDGKGGFQWLPKIDFNSIKNSNPDLANILSTKGYDAYIVELGETMEKLPDVPT